MPIVGLEPSCLLTLRDEYPEFIRTEAAKKVAENSFLLEEFVAREQKAGRLTLNANGGAKKVLLHGHCHQKALVGTAPTIAMLKAAGYEVAEVDSGRSEEAPVRPLALAQQRPGNEGAGGEEGVRGGGRRRGHAFLV